MAVSQGTIDAATKLKRKILEIGVVLNKAKESILPTTYDNLRNRHNAVYETFSSFYERITTLDDNAATDMIANIDDEMNNIVFTIKNSLAAKKDKVSDTAKQIVREAREKVEDSIKPQTSDTLVKGAILAGGAAALITIFKTFKRR